MNEQPESSFAAAVEPLRGALRLHCYRMLGSSHDGDDMVQETLLRAWRSRATLADPAMLRPWLYRIATNACLDELKRRPRRVLATDAYPPADPVAPIAPKIEEPVWLEPIPDTWLEGSDDRDPASRYALKESVALAFVAALQMLSAVQRATLLLRDVVGLSAEETAESLGVTVGAANSALFRARATVEEKLGGKGAPAASRETVAIDEALLARYVRAFDEADLDTLVALLHEDVHTSMPPSPTWVTGRAANEAFYRRRFAGLRPGDFRHVRIAANGQPAFAFYRAERAGGPLTLHAIQLVTVRDGAIRSIDHFMLPELYAVFAVARAWAPSA